MSSYTIKFHPNWEKYYSKLDHSIRERVVKKMLQITTNVHQRHLKYGLDHNVAEVGQYRICFLVLEQRKELVFCFVGDHNDYIRWLSAL